MEATTLPVSPDTQPQGSIFDRAVSLTVTFGAIGNRRKISASQVDVDADKAWIAASKQLLDSPELRAIRKLDGEIRTYLYKLCLPSMMKSGIFLLPMTLVPNVENTLHDYNVSRQKLVDDFLAAYEQRKQEAAAKLQDLYNPDDYPSEGKVRSAFTLEWQYVTFTTPGKLREISAAFFEAERDKMAAKVAEATNEIQQLLRATMQELVTHMVERLEPGADGKKKTFHKTTVENLAEFLRTFDARNITDDQQLKGLVDQAVSLLEGLDADKLRSNESLRAGVQSSLSDIKATLDTLVVEGANRCITFDEE